MVKGSADPAGGMVQVECHFGCLSKPSKKERVGWKLGKDQLTQKEGIS
jgi:hypothetical protein